MFGIDVLLQLDSERMIRRAGILDMSYDKFSIIHVGEVGVQNAFFTFFIILCKLHV